MAVDVTGISTSATSPSLLALVRQNDPQAWSRFSRIYSPLVYAWSRRCGLSAEDSAEIVQEVFVVLSQRIHLFRATQPTDRFRGWLWTIARNKVRDHQRRMRDRAVAAGGSTAYQHIQELAAEADEPWQSDDERSQSETGVVTRALSLISAEFEPATWLAFWSAAVDQKTAAETAAALGMTKHAVHQAKYRVLRRLRQELEGVL